jgi:hypothetical protein
MLLALGLQGLLRLQYNPFQDKASIFISVFAVGYLNLMKHGFFYLGERFLWRIDAASTHVGDDGIDIGIELRIPDWKESEGHSGRREVQSLGFGSFEDFDTDDFKHKFLEKNRPWILKQLKLIDSGIGAKNSLSDELLEMNSRWDLGEYVRDDISEDSGSDEESQVRIKQSVQLAPGSRKILRLWMVSTRRRLGLPDAVGERFDISSESDSEEDQPNGGKVVRKPNHNAKKIGHLWLLAVRGQLQPIAKIAVDVSDDSDEEHRDRFQSTQISAASREIGRLWLGSIIRSSSSKAGIKVVLSSSDNDDSEIQARIKPKTRNIAILWKQSLQNMQQEVVQHYRQANPGLISSDSPSGEIVVPAVSRARAQATRLVENLSETDDSSSEAMPLQDALRIPVKTKIIAQRWLNLIRSRSR